MNETISKKYIRSRQQIVSLDNQLKDERQTNAILLDEIKHTNEEKKRLQDRLNLYQSGGVMFTNLNGYVNELLKFPNDHYTTYSQEIHISCDKIGTVLYKKYPYIKVDNGKIIVDEVQYKKYKEYIGGII